MSGGGILPRLGASTEHNVKLVVVLLPLCFYLTVETRKMVFVVTLDYVGNMSLFSRKSKEERQAAKVERKEAKAAEKAKIGKQVTWLNASSTIFTLYENGYIQRQEGFKS